MTPVSTIYVNNLNEKIKIIDVVKSLKAVFSQFGEIVDITAAKNLKMHGQAFISFKDPSSAVAAVQKMQQFPFYDKPLKIQLAKKDSDAIAKLKGTYVERPKILRPKVEKNKSSKKSVKKVNVKPLPTNNPAITLPVVQASVPNIISPYNVPVVKPYPMLNIEEPPNNILYVTNLPKDASVEILSNLFGRFPGFKEARPVPYSGIAFVEYEKEEHAGQVKIFMQGFAVTPNHRMCISFAKKA